MINELHGKTIKYSELFKLLPDRNAYLDKKIFKKVNADFKNEKEILFMPSSLHDERPMQDSKYSKSKYKLVLFGICKDGRKLSVCINNIAPYFEMKIPAGVTDVTDEDFAKNIFNELNMEGPDDLENFNKVTEVNKRMPEFGFKIEVEKHEVVEGKPLHLFQEFNSKYIKFYFNKLQHRKDAISYIRAKGYETANDDTTCYYRVVTRDYFLTLGSWLVIKNFTTQSDGMNAYIKGDIIQANILNIKSYTEELTDYLLKDNTMTMCWDIETYNSLNNGDIPFPKFKEHNMFMIGITFQWHHSNNQLLRVCLVDIDSDPHPDFLTVVCDNEQNIIKAFGKCFNKMKPEYVMGFNDANYDWHWLIERAKSYKLLKYLGDKMDMMVNEKRDENSVYYNYKKISTKIEANTNVDGQNLQLPGYIPIDVMISFRKLYPTSRKWGLNFFLSENRLGTKEDMPYKEMFEIYRLSVKSRSNISKSLLEKMALVAKYCIMDSQKCHELMLIRNVIQDYREVANASYTSLYDTVYRADGMKVRNLVIAYGNLRNLKISNMQNTFAEDLKYPGAFVLQPVKGLVTSKLSIAERIEKAKEYDEYKEWLKLSDEDIIKCKDYIDKNGVIAEETTSDLPRCFNDMLTEDMGRPITGLDFSSLYPSLMMTYNFSPEYIVRDKKYARELTNRHTLHRIEFPFNGRLIKGWSIRHDNKTDTTSKDCKFGIFPSILKELFDARKKLKNGARGLEYWEHMKEEYLLLPLEEFNSAEIQEKYNNACFQYNMINSKQKALKVFMNTFYGESGNKRSTLFMLEIAGGITSEGKKNIKLAYKFIKKRNFNIRYGDTDSLYLSIPEASFKKLDIDYYTEKISKLEYWEKMVELTFREIVPINNDVNNMFETQNGTKFLKMSYEEVLFPVVFMAKKKYVGIPHLSKPNFDEKVPLFIRGLDLIKRNASELSKDIANDVLKKIFNSKNILTIMEIVHNKIKEIYNTDWSNQFNKFILTGVYKPTKQNIKMHTFKTRMHEERNIDIIPNERTEYVVVKKYPFKFNLRGAKTHLSVGDKMELANIALEETLPIDLNYYVENTLCGQFARFIIYHPNFHIDCDSNDEAEIKKVNGKIYDKSKSYIIKYCGQYNSSYTCKGPIYKNIFKKCSKIVETKMLQTYNTDSSRLIIKLLGFSVDPDDNLEAWIIKKIHSTVERKKKNKDYGKTFVDNYIKFNKTTENLKSKNIIDLQQVYFASQNSIVKNCESQYQERQAVLESRLRQTIIVIQNLYHTNNKIIEEIANNIIKKIDLDNKFNTENDILPTTKIDEFLEDNELNLEQYNKQLNDITDNNISNYNDKLINGITELKFIYYNLISNYEYIFHVRCIVDYLKSLRDKKIGNISITQNESKSIIEKFTEESVNEFLSEKILN
jgi:DNA polymerase elongation subunit (family B)